MAMPRRYANRAEQQAAYRERVAAAREEELQSRGLPSLPAIPTIPGTRRWEALQRQALTLLQTQGEEMQSYFAARSAEWQASESGEALEERLEMLEEITTLLEGLGR